MRNHSVSVLLAVLAAGVARADEASESAGVTNAPQSTPAIRDHGGFGLGAIVGEPTGVSAKLWLTDKTAIDAAAAWSFEGEDAFHLHADYLYHTFDLIPVSKGELPVYFGVGGRVKFREHDHDRAGIRAPVGISYLFADLPLEAFAEVAPILDVAPRTRLDLNGGIGIRYYFR